MAGKAKTVPTAESETEPENDEVVSEESDRSSEEILNDKVTHDRRNQRKDEWGTQCDRWLIRCQQKGKSVLLYLHGFDPKDKDAGIKAIPKRIDQHFVQFEFDGREVWVGKRFIAGIEGGQPD
jgi:polyphosphate kinase 2 (PPK2 family)